MELKLFGDLETLLTFSAIIGITIALSWAFNFVARRYIRKAVHKLNADPTNYQFIRHLVIHSATLILNGWSAWVGRSLFYRGSKPWPIRCWPAPVSPR